LVAIGFPIRGPGARLARDLIARFGRYPHRNAVLGRVSTPEEEEYITTGAFPHLRSIPTSAEGIAAMLAAGKASPS
jgi:hypothetical protein